MATRKLTKWMQEKELRQNTQNTNAEKQNLKPPFLSPNKKPIFSPIKREIPEKLPQKVFSPKPQPRKDVPRAAETSQRKFSDHVPDKGRPTHEKRQDFHPTNFLKPRPSGDIRVVPIGGMEQVGLNMMFIEWNNEILIIDAGVLFPSPEHLGVDVIVPDVSYLIQNKNKIRGILITHGHLDHIGGIPYFIKDLGFPPIFTSRLTKELILANSEEHIDTNLLKITEVTPNSRIKLGKFECEFFHVNHSIPESLGLSIHTPYGAIVHSSDFKIDHNPADNMPADLATLSKIGHQGVILAMVDSTNVEKSGHTQSEFFIAESLEKLVHDTKGRLIVTTFATNIGRVARLIESAEKYGRTVFLSGRSMEKNIAIARKLNYLKCKDKTLQRMSSKANSLPPSQVMILSTGSQGEELAALTRMAAGTHKEIKLTSQDTIVFSSSPIPGNELSVVSVLNNLSEIGCKVVDKEDLDIYVSGHGHKEELKLFTSLIDPKFFAPIHGELYMRKKHQELVVRELGFKKENTFIMKNGQGILINEKGARLMSEKERIHAPLILIENREKIGPNVLPDRERMADDGAIFISIMQNNGSAQKVSIRARGFLYMNTKNEIFTQIEKEVKTSFISNFSPEKSTKALEDAIQKTVTRLFLQKLKKEPVVEVVIL